MAYHNDFQQAIGAPVKNWEEASYPPRTPMLGRYCKIMPLDVDAHAQQLFKAFSENTDHKNWTYMFYGPFDYFEAFKNWLDSICGENDPFFYSLIDLKTGTALGLASHMRIDQKMGVIEIGNIHFSPALKQSAMATEAMFLMMQRVFDQLGYRRYEWKCDALNEPSRKAALRLGFSFEGIFRQAMIYKGRNRDTAWYSIIDSEWPNLKQAFEIWLDPANFDVKGCQRQCLHTILTDVIMINNKSRAK